MVTIRDVAGKSGFSITTVSMVLSPGPAAERTEYVLMRVAGDPALRSDLGERGRRRARESRLTTPRVAQSTHRYSRRKTGAGRIAQGCGK